MANDHEGPKKKELLGMTLGDWSKILVSAVATFLVSGVLIGWWNGNSTSLIFKISNDPSFPGSPAGPFTVIVEVTNNGGKEIEDIQCRLAFAASDKPKGAFVRPSLLASIVTTDFDDIGRNDDLLNAAFLGMNFNAIVAKAQSLNPGESIEVGADFASKPVIYDAIIRGKGVIGRLETSFFRRHSDVIISSSAGLSALSLTLIWVGARRMLRRKQMPPVII